jgi:hypothetical protein
MNSISLVLRMIHMITIAQVGNVHDFKNYEKFIL